MSPENAPETPAVDDVPDAAPPPAEPDAATPAQSVAADAGPAAVAKQLRTLFPGLFAGPPKPLKLRIQSDIQQRAPGTFTKQALSGFLRRLTGSHGYLLALTRAKHRFDLDGAPAGELSEEHRQAAVEELARRRGNREAREAAEEDQRRQRATLLRDFESTRLTEANFCALKGLTPEQLQPLLAQARQELQDRRQALPSGEARDPRRAGPPGRRPDRPERPDRPNGPRGPGRPDRRPR